MYEGYYSGRWFGDPAVSIDTGDIEAAAAGV